jgi:hypothetical protein
LSEINKVFVTANYGHFFYFFVISILNISFSRSKVKGEFFFAQGFFFLGEKKGTQKGGQGGSKFPIASAECVHTTAILQELFSLIFSTP